MTNGLLLVAHGTRSQLGIAQFLCLAARLEQRLRPLPVEPAFLELAEPTIEVAVGKLLECEIGRLITMPLLLFAAAHAKDDIPSAVQAALYRHRKPGLIHSQTAHLGCHPHLLALSKQRLEEAISPRVSRVTSPDSGTTCHLLVGRGSSDDSATAEMHEYARLLGEVTQLTTAVAFLAMAKPQVAEQLQALAVQGFKRIIVQPHLLFHGDLVESVQRQVAAASVKSPNIEFLTAATLADPPEVAGPATERLEKIVLDRFHAATTA